MFLTFLLTHKVDFLSLFRFHQFIPFCKNFKLSTTRTLHNSNDFRFPLGVGVMESLLYYRFGSFHLYLAQFGSFCYYLAQFGSFR